MKVFTVFAVLAIVIACLGLYGLANFITEQRRKEVGVRKVCGASLAQVLILLVSDFMKLVSIAFVIAVPIAYFGMNRWLDKFPYKEKIDLLLFVISGVMILAITFFVISQQAIRTARTNPVQSLRSE